MEILSLKIPSSSLSETLVESHVGGNTENAGEATFTTPSSHQIYTLRFRKHRAGRNP